MKEYLIRLFEFNLWASKKLIESIQMANEIPNDAILLLSHTAESAQIWMQRIKKLPPREGVFEILSKKEACDLLIKTAEDWITFIKNDFDESVEFSYTNLQGKQFTSKQTDLFIHLVNHATYHRGQIVKSIRPFIEVAPVTDFIAYARQF